MAGTMSPLQGPPTKWPWLYLCISVITVVAAVILQNYELLWNCQRDIECDEVARRIDNIQHDIEFVEKRLAYTRRVSVAEEVILGVSLASAERALDKALDRLDGLTAEAGARQLPTVHIMTILRGQESFGELRTFQNHMDQLARQTYPRHKISLAFLVSEDGYYRYVKRVLPRLAQGYARLSVVQRDFHWTTGRADHERHDHSVQQLRRSLLAQYRNQLFYLTYNNEDFTLWIDADMIDLPPDTVSALVEANRDIVVPRCLRQGKEYDLNAWLGKRLTPKAKSFYPYFIPQPAGGADGAIHMDIMANLSPADIVPLHSVGGTTLMVKSAVHLQGVMFAPTYVIGSDWDTVGGYDAIETESLCYIARTLNHTCWGLLGHYVEHHWE